MLPVFTGRVVIVPQEYNPRFLYGARLICVTLCIKGQTLYDLFMTLMG